MEKKPQHTDTTMQKKKVQTKKWNLSSNKTDNKSFFNQGNDKE